MNKKELVELLQDIAGKDLSTDSVIYDHPCSVAVRAIEQYEEDIALLRSIIKGNESPLSERAQAIIKSNYQPAW